MKCHLTSSFHHHLSKNVVLPALYPMHPVVNLVVGEDRASLLLQSLDSLILRAPCAGWLSCWKWWQNGSISGVHLNSPHDINNFAHPVCRVDAYPWVQPRLATSTEIIIGHLSKPFKCATTDLHIQAISFGGWLYYSSILSQFCVLVNSWVHAPPQLYFGLKLTNCEWEKPSGSI